MDLPLQRRRVSSARASGAGANGRVRVCGRGCAGLMAGVADAGAIMLGNEKRAS